MSQGTEHIERVTGTEFEETSRADTDGIEDERAEISLRPRDAEGTPEEWYASVSAPQLRKLSRCGRRRKVRKSRHELEDAIPEVLVGDDLSALTLHHRSRHGSGERTPPPTAPMVPWR